MSKIINLLPKSRQQELRYIAIYRSIFAVFLLSLATFVLVFLAQIGTRFYLQSQALSLTKEIALLQNQVNKKENAKIKVQVQAANDLVSDYKNLSESTPKWSKVIKAFVALPPEGVKINTFSINPNTKVISIAGFSPTRALVIQLYNNILADTKDFSNIDYPLENVAKPSDISFHFMFNIQDQLLKP